MSGSGSGLKKPSGSGLGFSLSGFKFEKCRVPKCLPGMQAGVSESFGS